MFNTKLKKQLEFYQRKSAILKMYLDFCLITEEVPSKRIIQMIDDCKSLKLLDETGEAIFNKTQEACRVLIKK